MPPCDVNLLTSHVTRGAASCFSCMRYRAMADVPAVQVRLLECARKGLFYLFVFFSSLVPLQRWNHLLAPLQWQLVGMHIVIKQFPVCKCPVYTFLLQSLSLDRLLEYEKHSHRMKNENSRTSIKNLLCALSAEEMAETDVKEDPDTNTHTHYRGKKKKKKRIKDTLCYSSLMEEAVGKLLA